VDLLTAVVVFLLKSVVGFYLYVLLARVWMQKSRVNYFNPLSQFVVKLTDPVVKPCRRVIPGFRGFDLATIFLILSLQFCLLISVFAIQSPTGLSMPWLIVLLYSFGKDVLLLLNVLSFFVVIAALSTWVQSRKVSMIGSMIGLMVQPIMTMVRRFVPRIGGAVDLSPLIVLLFIQVLRIILWYVMGVIGGGYQNFF
jgi:YggT family protein